MPLSDGFFINPYLMQGRREGNRKRISNEGEPRLEVPGPRLAADMAWVHLMRPIEAVTGRFQMQEVKTGFCRNRSMKTGSSETLIGWKSEKNHLCPSMGQNGGSVAMENGLRSLVALQYPMF